MPLVPDTVLDEIQARVDIAELIGRYVPLKRAGRHFKARCPFHQERTPSFHVNTDKQIFHCFGCGVGGNIFGFLMQQDRLTFPEAVQQLAEQAGVEVPAASREARDDQRDHLLAVLEKACQYYERVLAHPEEGRLARAYIVTRGVTEDTRRAFRLGAAPMAGWDRLVAAAQKTKNSTTLLQEAGLILQGQRGWVDRFRQRVLFPLQDVRGRVVGFGGRSLANQEPKYLNGPETAVYSKGRQLFGWPQAKEAILKLKAAVVVEGYFDCVVLWQAGIRHVVSPLGVALTAEQAKLLARYAERVVLAFDADAAGDEAALRGIDVLVEAGLSVQVAHLPRGVDPDEQVRAVGTAGFQELLDQAAGVCDFLLACAVARYNTREATGKVRAAQFVLPTVAKVSNAMLRSEYVRLIAERLRLDERAVMEELQKVKPRTFNAPASAAMPPAKTPAGQGSRLMSGQAERLLVALLLDEPVRWAAIREATWVGELEDERLQQIVSTVQAMHEAPQPQAGAPTARRGPLTAAQVISRVSTEPGMATLVAELVQTAQAIPAKEETFRQCVVKLETQARSRELAALREEMAQAQQQGREAEVTRLLGMHQHLMKQRAHGRTR